MIKSEYLLYSYKKENHLVFRWYIELFSILFDEKEYEYITIKNGIKYYKILDENGNLIKLEETNTSKYESILNIEDIIKIDKGSIPNLQEDIYTSIGIFIANLLYLVYPFGDRIKYNNGYFTLKSIESKLPKLLKDNIITVEDHKNFVNSVSFSLNLNKLFSFSSTKKSITPAKGLSEFKESLENKYNKEYGENWVKDEAIALQFIEEMKKYDNNYIKDDPSYGKLMSGKIISNSRPRMYMSFGVETGFGTDGVFIKNSLADGYKKDKVELKTIMNSARKGSFDRGSETQQAGAMVKEMQRASNSITIKDGDCGSKEGLEVYVNDLNIERYKNVYVIQNGVSVFKESIESYKGKYINIRNPQYCKYKDNYCEICSGKELLEYRNGISLLIISSAGVVLNLKMKGMHKASKHLHNFNILNTIV